MLLAWSPLARAQVGSVEVGDGWRYRWGDSPVGADGVPAWARESGEGAGWAPTDALHEPPGRGDDTLLWLSLPMPEGAWLEPALFLGAVANAYEVYLDGRRIHSSGKVRPGGSEVVDSMGWHLVPLPPGTAGKRVLLRIQSTGSTIGVTRDARVGARHALLTEATREGLAPFVMGVLLGAIALVAVAAMFLQERQRRMLVALAMFSASSGLLLVGASGLCSALWSADALGTQLLLVGAYGLLPGLAWFISDSILEGRKVWFHRFAVAFSVPTSLLAALALVDVSLALRLLQPFSGLSLPSLFLCVVVAAVAAWRGNPDARIFVVGLGILTGVLLLGMLPLLGLMDSVDSYVHWGFLAFTLSLVGIVARRSSLVVRSLAQHMRQLEARRNDVRELAQGMGSGAGELATVVQQLRTSSEEQTAGISRQATALKELEQTVQEIRQGSMVTADKARVLSNSVVVAEEAGRDGGAAISRTLTNLEAIRSEVSEMARRILALDARTREVSGIVDTVKALADQSNMLAVNAAIEAARSGEHGRGFGVVSREVRSLADQSILATQRIREVLDGVSASMREAAKVSEQGEQRVRVSLDAVRVSGSQLQKLTGIISETSSSVRQISAAVAQQDAGTSQIAVAIQDLSGQMQQTLRVVEETQKVTRSVQTLAESMSGTAKRSLASGTLDA
ncbi:methyl-accepting chemotaxis protein [Myxococcus sp. K15C18031901]|uniref:methyl-accepting chemotaxis protein n=1 Tax=Myxococcus dinghuensis TaxID=2906761 RepID=UPI0020A75B0D|nr:methyl-accepting chemotaxis protein [Myxococcus dinghuensis]MCP3102145.1 methyl-accepting chemotaxis protein [Myxococcus dinghuensis]